MARLHARCRRTLSRILRSGVDAARQCRLRRPSACGSRCWSATCTTRACSAACLHGRQSHTRRPVRRPNRRFDGPCTQPYLRRGNGRGQRTAHHLDHNSAALWRDSAFARGRGRQRCRISSTDAVTTVTRARRDALGARRQRDQSTRAGLSGWCGDCSSSGGRCRTACAEGQRVSIASP